MKLSTSGFLLLLLGVVGIALFLTGNLNAVLARLFSTPAAATGAAPAAGVATGLGSAATGTTPGGVKS